MRRVLSAVATAALAVGFALVSTGIAHAAIVLDDDFHTYSAQSLSEGQTLGNWTDVFNGGGSQSIFVDAGGTHYLRQQPQTSTSSSETHASLTTSSSSITKPVTLHYEYQNQQQLRTGSSPNPWEVGWALFNYTDNNHFYYVALKTNGWELGKEWLDSNNVQQQQFLASGSTPTYAIGHWLQLDLTVSYPSSTSATITVKAKDQNLAQQTLTTFTDDGTTASGAAYQSGKVGLYNEDAKVDWGYVKVTT